jgi:CBS domain-containing protein
MTTRTEPNGANGLGAAPRSLWERTVAEAMHAGVLTCPLEASLADVAEIMAAERIHCVVVLSESSGESPWGVVSDLDLVAAASRGGPALAAGALAAAPVVTVSPTDTLDRVAQLMAEYQAAHLIVADDVDGLPIGIVSSLDVARALAQAQAA